MKKRKRPGRRSLDGTPGPSKRVVVRVREDTKEWLRAVGTTSGRPVAEVIRRLVEEAQAAAQGARATRHALGTADRTESGTNQPPGAPVPAG